MSVNVKKYLTDIYYYLEKSVKKKRNIENVPALGRIVIKWLKMYEFYERRYTLLVKFVASMLILPHSNAEYERIFNYLSKTQTQFQSQMISRTLEKLLL